MVLWGLMIAGIVLGVPWWVAALPAIPFTQDTLTLFRKDPQEDA